MTLSIPNLRAFEERRCLVEAVRRVPVGAHDPGGSGANDGVPQTEFSEPEGLGHFAGRCIQVDKNERVHNVHTLGFGSGRTGAGLGLIGDVCGGAADFQVLEPGSSPTWGTA